MTYAQALLPAATRIAGVWLPALTLGHVFWLARLDSPFLVGGPARAGLGDLALGLELCRQADPLAVRLPRWRLRWRSRRLARAAWEPNCRALGAWIARQCRLPDHWVKSGRKRAPGAPWPLIIKITLHNLGHANDAALRLPVAQALWECAAWWEAEERLELVTDSERVVMAQARQRASEQSAPAPSSSSAGNTSSQKPAQSAPRQSRNAPESTVSKNPRMPGN